MDFEKIIIYEDDDILVVDKPAGIASEGARIGQQDIESLAKNYRSSKGESAQIHMIHRLDQPVGGVLLMAKNKEAAANLTGQLTAGKIEKIYTAKVHGIPSPEKGTLKNYLKCGPGNMTLVVQNPGRDVKTALLEYEVLETGIENSVLRITLRTGRHHQIRVQFANAGHPLVGDRKYGAAETRPENLALQASELRIFHPKTGEPMRLKTFSEEFCAN